jgi:hypothetical protein
MGSERSPYRRELLTIPYILYTTKKTIVLYVVDSLVLEVVVNAFSELSMTMVHWRVGTGNSTVLGPGGEIAGEGAIGGEGTLIWRECWREDSLRPLPSWGHRA